MNIVDSVFTEQKTCTFCVIQYLYFHVVLGTNILFCCQNYVSVKKRAASRMLVVE